MAVRKGRPRKEDARREQFRLRMNEKESKMLNAICERHNLTRSDALREAVVRMYREE